MKRELVKYIAVLVAAVAAFGCIHENLDDCYPTVGERTYRVYFGFAGGEASDIDPADVKALDLYVFDRYGYYLTLYRDEKPALDREDYFIELTLSESEDYRFVAWGNASPQYGYTLNTSEDASHDSWTVVPEAVTEYHLLYGALDTQGVTRSGEDDGFVVELYQNSYTVTITTEGITASDQIYTLDITDYHEGYSFAGEPVYGEQGKTGTYVCERDVSGQPFASARVYGLGQGISAVCAFTNATTGTLLYRESLAELIRQANSQGAALDFAAVHNFHIHLEFDWKMDVTVSINDWKITDEFHELGR